MSFHETPPPPKYGYPQPLNVAPQQDNMYGVIGFALSMLGIVFCIAAPAGLILSVIGLRKEPKVFAIIGTIISTLTLLVHLTILAFYGAFFLACIGMGFALQPSIVTALAIREAGQEIEGAKAAGGMYPTAEEGNKLISDKSDYWEGQLRYEPTDKGFVIRSAGPDKQFETSDDVTMDDVQLRELETPSYDEDLPAEAEEDEDWESP